MKYLLTIAFVFACITSFGQQSIDGNWKGTRETPNGTFEVNYTFKVEGKLLTGVWKTQFGESKLEEGKIDGSKLSFTISFNDMKLSYTGDVTNENEIVLKSERGEMKLARVKS